MRLGEGEHERTVETAGAPEVEILDRGVDAQAGRLQAALQATVVAVLGLAIDEEPEALLEGERRVVGPLALLGIGARHAAEAEGLELLERGVDEHGVLLLQA